MKYNELTDVFSAWAEASRRKSMPRWDDYKENKKKHDPYIDMSFDVFDGYETPWKLQPWKIHYKMLTPEEEKKEWKENHINEIKETAKEYEL